MSGIQINPTLSLTLDSYQINKKTLLDIKGKTILAGITLLGIIFMFMLPITRRVISRFISWLPRLLFFTTSHFRQHLSERLHVSSHVILDNLAMGFEVLKNPYMIVACLLLSVCVWILNFFSFYVLVLGCKGVNITFLQASASMIIMCFFIMLPSVPGYWGIWEVGGIYGLMIFGVPKDRSSRIDAHLSFLPDNSTHLAWGIIFLVDRSEHSEDGITFTRKHNGGREQYSKVIIITIMD